MKRIYFVCIIAFLLVSCRKFLEVNPPANQVTSDRVFTSDETAFSTINGIYSEMMNNGNQFSASGITFYAGMYSDELRYYIPSERDEFVNNEIGERGQSTIEVYFWNSAYKYIYAANLTLDKLQASTEVSTNARNQITGEAKFIRAFCYFYLVNLFGDVPLILTSDYTANEKLGRTTSDVVYEMIESDLQEAANLLPDNYLLGERVRPTKYAAYAMLSRLNLYRERWDKAEHFATNVIQSGIHELVDDLPGVFLKNSTEAIWQLLPVNPAYNTWEGVYILPATTSAQPTYIFQPSFIDAIGNGDLRREHWFSYREFQSEAIYYPTKYKVKGINVPITEYYMVLRLSEQFLIRAEARLHLNDVPGSLEDLNRIRARAGLDMILSGTPAELFKAIELERRVELAAEWGHRWFDLKRTKRAAEVLKPVKPQWQNTDALWPIPQNQIRANPNLKQNAGY